MIWIPKRRKPPVDRRQYRYSVVSNFPLGISVAEDYGNIIIEAYAPGSELPPGRARTVSTDDPLADEHHHVTMCLTEITDLAGQPVNDSRPKLRIVK